MRTLVLFLAPLSMVVVAAGSVRVADAADSTLFYAPPTEMPSTAMARTGAITPPLVVEGRRQVVSKRLEPPRGRVCFNTEETRNQITALRLAEPVSALRVGRMQGEALRAKLCRWRQDEFVYEIAVLRHDGRIVHVYMNAQSGKDVAP